MLDVYLTGGGRAVLARAAEHIDARATGGVHRVAELVLDVRAELDRVGAAELLLREADGELGGQLAVDLVSDEATGLTVITGVMFSDQESSVEETPVALLVITRFQVPSAIVPCRLASVAGLTYSGM